MKIFIFWSRWITLSDECKSYILSKAQDNNLFIIWDSIWIDNEVQIFLNSIWFKNVEIYHIWKLPRNNAWSRKSIEISEESSKKYGWRIGWKWVYINKDIAMCNDCDEAIAIWDWVSQGTMRNIKNLNKIWKPIKVFSCGVAFKEVSLF